MYMEAQEAIVNLKYVTNRWADSEDMYSDTMEIEIDQEFINTLYTAKAALKKQIPKKPKLATRADGIIKFYPCPCCSTSEKYISVYPKQKYCVECGQKLDWKE